MTHRFLHLAASAAIIIALAACDHDTPTTKPEPKPDPTPEVVENYIEGGEQRYDLPSALYFINGTEFGQQYIFALSPTEGLTSYDDIVAQEEYIFLSIDQDTLLGSTDSVDVMELSADNELYIFYMSIGDFTAKRAIADNAKEHKAITSGTLSFAVTSSNDISLEAHYTTRQGDEITLKATVPYVIPDTPTGSGTITSTIGSAESVSNILYTAFMEQSGSSVIYTLCTRDALTYAMAEDATFIKIEVEGYSGGEDFTIDLATDSNYTIKYLYATNESDFRLLIDDSKRQYTAGSITLQGGDIACSLRYDSPDGADNDLTIEANYCAAAYRSINECCYREAGEENEVHRFCFAPRSVVFDKSADPYRIYVSGTEGITTIDGMTDAEVIVELPATYERSSVVHDSWELLLSGNFAAGSTHPTMSIWFEGATYTKGDGKTNGMNIRCAQLDEATQNIRLIANLYPSEGGGMGLYYSGSFTIIE